MGVGSSRMLETVKVASFTRSLVLKVTDEAG